MNFAKLLKWIADFLLLISLTDIWFSKSTLCSAHPLDMDFSKGQYPDEA